VRFRVAVSVRVGVVVLVSPFWSVAVLPVLLEHIYTAKHDWILACSSSLDVNGTCAKSRWLVFEQ